MHRRNFLRTLTWGGAFIVASRPARVASASASLNAASGFPWEETTIADLQAAMDSGQASAASLVHAYCGRIEAVDQSGPGLNAVIELNPDASNIAEALDRERRSHGPRSPMHGIPVLIKDNIDTGDRMQTTAGSLALAGSVAPRDSFVAERLRQSGAVLLGKTNLSEWANFRSSHSTSGWSGRGGLTLNPYALDRNPSGSSSGSAVAVSASLCPVAIGTETDGSIMSPSAVCGVVGIKPTVGLLSRAGIIPISRSQDTAGPMGRTVRDAATLLGCLTGVDARDDATQASRGRLLHDYTRRLSPDGLRGARLGVARQFFRGRVGDPVLEAALSALKAAGATLIDPADIPAVGQFGGEEFEVMLYEFKAGLNAYLAERGPGVPVRSLTEVIEFNEAYRDRELKYFGQETLERAESKGPLTDAVYREALAKCRRLAREEGIDHVMDQHRLDAIVAPSGGPAAKTDLVYGDRGVGGSSSLAAVAGYPNITVPTGEVRGLPVGLSFFGRAFSEPLLIQFAYAFEQATQARKPPLFLPSVG